VERLQLIQSSLRALTEWKVYISEQVWRLIDCGLAAKVGAVVPVGFTRPWAPPEAVKAEMKSSKASSPEEAYRASLHTVSPALDAWSFGVVAYELVTTPSHIKPAIRGPVAEVCTVVLLHAF
jgi:hypothetical protein